MSVVAPLPKAGAVIDDATRARRSLRVSWHADRSLAVLSVWESDTCIATFHVAAADVGVLTGALLAGPLEGLA